MTSYELSSYTLSLDIRACPPWQPGTLGRFRARHADVSSRLCLVDCVALLARESIAVVLSRLDVALAMDRANEICPESDRLQNWEEGSTIWRFEDGSKLKIQGTEIWAT